MTTPVFDYAQFQADIIAVVARLKLVDSVQSFELDGNIGQFVAAVFPHPNAITPLPELSGQDVTSVRVAFIIRLYLAVSQQTPDVIDPAVLNATALIMQQFNAGFTFQETVFEVDLLGAYGMALDAHASYLKVGGPGGSSLYRTMDITVPVILADIWDQAR